MRVVDRETFLDMPRGTVFAKVMACDVGPLMIMNGRMGDDFLYREMIEVNSSGSSEFFDIMLAACQDKTRDTIPLDWDLNQSRDGLFEKDQLFAILDDKELTLLIDMLTDARNKSGGEITTLVQHTARQMAESVGLVWDKLPRKLDTASGHSAPERCHQYWHNLARISIAVIEANESKPE